MKNLLKQISSLVLPVTALVVVPILIENRLNLLVDIIFAVGLVFVFVGGTILSATIIMLIRIGRGTLAPWSPTRRLVISGMYSYVRNPMISGVMIALLGESLIFHSANIFVWLVVFFSVNHVYFIASEEPGLARTFGGEYLKYKRNVPRWIPRLTPWNPEEKKN